MQERCSWEPVQDAWKDWSWLPGKVNSGKLDPREYDVQGLQESCGIGTLSGAYGIKWHRRDDFGSPACPHWWCYFTRTCYLDLSFHSHPQRIHPERFSVVPTLATSASPGNLVEMQILRPQLSPTDSETLEIVLSNLHCSKPSRRFWCSLKLRISTMDQST